MNTKILLVMLSLLTSVSFAETWVSLGYEKYIDTDSILTSENGNKMAWAKTVLRQDDENAIRVFGEKLKYIQYFKTFSEYDCNNKRMRLYKAHYYGKWNDPLIKNNKAKSKMEDVKEKTLNEVEWNYVCKGIID